LAELLFDHNDPSHTSNMQIDTCCQWQKCSLSMLNAYIIIKFHAFSDYQIIMIAASHSFFL